MKKYRFTIIAILVSTIAFAQLPKDFQYKANYFNDFPSYKKMLTEYFNDHPADDRIPMVCLNFVKKYNGWHVDEYEQNSTRKLIQSHHYWKVETKDYHPMGSKMIVGQRASQSVEKTVRNYLNAYAGKFYDVYPLYGYIGYEKEVIQLLKKEWDLPPELINCLARAYSNQSTNILMPNQLNPSAKPISYDENYNPKTWDKKVLKEYIKHAEGAIKAFEQLEKRSPEFETIVGNISTKKDNEYVTHYYNLKIAQKPKLAKTFLVDGLYDEFLIETAKNYLKSCPQKAILFTYGDNDTYPLIYVQDHLKYRQDVTIINSSLMNLPRYVNYIKHVLPKDKQVVTTWDMSDYKNKIVDYLMIQNDTKETDVLSFFQRFKKDKINYKTSVQGYYYFPSSTFKIVSNEKNIPSLIWAFRKNYIPRGQLVMLDIITTNNWKRPICYTIGFNDNAYIYLGDYLRSSGFCSQLSTEKIKKTGYVLPIDLERTSALLSKKFMYSKIPKNRTKHQDVIQFIMQYQRQYLLLVNTHLKQENKAEAIRVLKDMQKNLPQKEIAYGLYTTYLADAAYQAGAADIGDEILLTEAKVFSPKFNDVMLEEERFLKGLILASEKHQRTTLTEELKELLKYYFK